MDVISGAKRMKTGILLIVETPAGKEEVTFGFEELVKMEINTLHLLQFPQKYFCDPRARVIRRRHGNRPGQSPVEFPTYS